MYWPLKLYAPWSSRRQLNDNMGLSSEETKALCGLRLEIKLSPFVSSVSGSIA